MNFSQFSISCVALLSSLSLSAAPLEPDPQPGSYATEGGWGSLEISLDGGGLRRFDIQTLSGENVCVLKGDIQAGVASEKIHSGVCRLQVTPKAQSILVKSLTPEICQGACGQTGDFDGVYERLASVCVPDKVERALSASRRHRQDNDPKKAVAALKPVVAQCLQGADGKRLMYFQQEGEVRISYARALLDMKKLKTCRDVLSVYAREVKLSPGQLAAEKQYRFPEFEAKKTMLGEARGVLKQCGQVD